MLDFVNSLLKKFFGSKAERDLKELTPFVGLTFQVAYYSLDGFFMTEFWVVAKS